MLVIYNESKTEWRHAKITDRMSKLVCSRVLKDNSVKYLDILYSNEIEMPELKEFTQMTDPKVLYAGDTNVNFQRKDLKPFIAKTDRTNTDILLVTVNLRGKILKNITNTKAAVLSYLIAKGELTFAVSLRDFGEGCSFEFTLHDYTLVNDTTYTFTKTENGYSLNTSTVVVEDVIMKPSYSIKRFRPNRVTHLVFVMGMDQDAFYDTYQYADKHEVCVFNSMSELEDKVNEYFKNGYRAATLFNNDDSVDREESNFTIINSKFKIMNVLLNNGKLMFIR